jgi:hypothetical protein
MAHIIEGLSDISREQRFSGRTVDEIIPYTEKLGEVLTRFPSVYGVGIEAVSPTPKEWRLGVSVHTQDRLPLPKRIALLASVPERGLPEDVPVVFKYRPGQSEGLKGSPFVYAVHLNS